jgi:sec-independent protein translocase protein TatA
MLYPLFIGGVGGPELVILFMLAVLLFGANKLPKLARASGEAMGEFQKGREGLEREIRDATDPNVTTDDSDLEGTADLEDNADLDADIDPDADFDVEADTDHGAPPA